MVQARRPFKDLEATRQDFDSSIKFGISKTVSPDWKWGDGANDRDTGLEKKHIEVDPSDPGRSAMSNYKLHHSQANWVSEHSKRGWHVAEPGAVQLHAGRESRPPPIFVVGFAGSSDKDTLKNLKATGECVINMISEHFIEAANAAAIDAPYGMSEWQLTGLTPASCRKVKVDRVRESMFSIEGRLLEIKDFESKFTKGVKSGSMAIIEGVHFWICEDALSKDQSTIDPAVLRPVARLGGMVYGRVMQAFEIPRPRYAESKDQLPNCPPENKNPV
ncbi:hypothetical protein LTS15_007594 [Exophiala xenobiotica]|nr:hypothetical protein LTS15_007594 [Exophiala xenobiotica]